MKKTMKISDEIREWCKWCAEHSAARDSLCKLANRIDNEMVELPRDRDGDVIHIGDTMYTADGRKAHVVGIHFIPSKAYIGLEFPSLGITADYIPHCIAHEHPDSLERIADELQEWSETVYVADNREIFDHVAEFADRIRKLAKKEGENSPSVTE